MYKRAKTHKKMVSIHGIEYTPVATLTDKCGGISHIVVDDGCYVCYLFSPEADGFVETHYIFPELHEALCSLPKPNEVTTSD